MPNISKRFLNILDTKFILVDYREQNAIDNLHQFEINFMCIYSGLCRTHMPEVRAGIGGKDLLFILWI